MRLELIEAVAVEPVSLAQAKLWLRVDHDAEDDLIGGLVASARDYIEGQTGLALAAQSWRLSVPPFALPVELPRPPFGELLGVQALQADGTTDDLMLADFFTVGVDPARILLRPGACLPWNTLELRFSYTCRLAAGVPPRAIQAIRMLIAHWYENREAIQSESRFVDQEPPHAVTALLDTLKLARL
jgi:uncharacterized phiE125 gp8 family phage protein